MPRSTAPVVQVRTKGRTSSPERATGPARSTPGNERLGAHGRDLAARLRVSQEENEILAERAEDILWFGLVARAVGQCEDPAGIPASVLEWVSVLKDISYCAFLEPENAGLVIRHEYAAFGEGRPTGAVLHMSKDRFDELVGARRGPREWFLPPRALSIPGGGLLPSSLVVLSSSPGDGPRLLFLAADRQRTEAQMAALVPLLRQIIDMTRARLERFELVREVTELSTGLVRCPHVRASGLDQAGSIRHRAAGLTRTAEERSRLESELRQALRRNEFVLHFQPQVSVRAGEIVGVEALLRWRHPDLGLVVPSRFVPLAEDPALVEAIGAWVLRSACRQVREWMAGGLPLLRVAVNLSEQELSTSSLAERIAATLVETGLDPGLLEVEIPEGSVLDHVEAAVSTLRAVKALGVTLALDDFGAGCSSLTSLRCFPIDRLKLDGSFIRQVGHDETDQAIARAAVELGHGLKLGVAADGVETPGQLEFLRTNGCDTYQGSLFAPALPPAECADLLRTVAV